MTRERVDLLMKVVVGVLTPILTVSIIGLFGMIRSNDRQFAVMEKQNDQFQKDLDGYRIQSGKQWEYVDTFRIELHELDKQVAVLMDRAEP